MANDTWGIEYKGFTVIPRGSVYAIHDPEGMILTTARSYEHAKALIDKRTARVVVKANTGGFSTNNPHRSNLTDKEQLHVKRLMRKIGVKTLKVEIDPSSSRDLAVYLSDEPGYIPHVKCGQKWLKAPYHERMKRLLHEMCHVKGMRHDTHARKLGYTSNPEKDQYSRDLYYYLTGVRL